MELEPIKLQQTLSCMYDRAVALYRYAPDMWLEYAHFKAENDWEGAVQVIKRGMEPLASSLFYQLGCCDFYEIHHHLEEAVRQYEQLVSSSESALGWIQYIYFTRRTKGIEEARQIFRRARLSVLQPELFIAAGTILIGCFISSP